MSAMPITTTLASTNATNKSPSKQMYSFSKSSRFGNPKLDGCQKVSYNLPTTNVNRTTSFGLGSRFDGSFGKVNIIF
jgi:hypothetical protein